MISVEGLTFLKDKKYLKPLGIISFLIILSLIFLKIELGFLIKAAPKVNKLAGDIRAAEKDIAAKKSFLEKYELLNLELARRDRMAISYTDVSSLLSEISKIAKDSGVKLVEIKPRQLGKEEAGFQGQAYYRLLIELDLDAGYHPLGGFINRLENYERHIRLTGLEISSSGNTSLGHRVKMTIETLVLK